jgi:hypothetical protein
MGFIYTIDVYKYIINILYPINEVSISYKPQFIIHIIDGVKKHQGSPHWGASPDVRSPSWQAGSPSIQEGDLVKAFPGKRWRRDGDVGWETICILNINKP